MKRKNLIIGALIMLAMLVSGFTYAYWASSVTNGERTQTGTVKIGTGEEVTSTFVIDPEQNLGGNLVPVGFEDGTKVNNLDLTFDVLWTTDNPVSADALEGVLTIVKTSVLINGADYSHLFTVSFTSEVAITEDVSLPVVVNVEFTNEPVDEDEYALVANQNLVITLTFTVNPN